MTLVPTLATKTYLVRYTIKVLNFSLVVDANRQIAVLIDFLLLALKNNFDMVFYINSVEMFRSFFFDLGPLKLLFLLISDTKGQISSVVNRQ